MADNDTARKGSRRPLYSLENSPSHLLHRAQQRAADVTAQALRTYGLTPRQYAVLVALREDNAVTQSDLVRITGIDRSTLADMLTRMGKRMLTVSKRTETDQRANLVTITPKGLRALEAVTPRVADAQARMLEALPNNMRDSFVSALQVLAEQSRR
jgi:DNA-binding MarR family transcriptional regulator